jgi:UDP-2,3-diacylglucosamine hydrolase
VSICFIADLHLAPNQEQEVERFRRFLKQDASQHKALYILGDLFNVWLGDRASASNYQSTITALNKLTTSGTAIFIQHGNRDFLLGEYFLEATGATLIDDPHRIEVKGRSILLTHGDKLCIDDISYQRYRRFIRNPLIESILHHLPATVLELIGSKVRTHSEQSKTSKQSSIMDVTQSEVEQIMRSWSCFTMVHGHTHRPAIHSFELDGKPALRVVVGDWESEQNVVSYKSGDFIQQSI